jgi:thioester reductase-like protein
LNDYILLTGATGLLGRYLLRDLLRRGCKVAVVVRPSKRLSARERVEQILQMHEAESETVLPRPVIFAGDICADHLGLALTEQQWIAENCSRVLHSAATLTFHQDASGEPRRTNVGGTKNLLQLCNEASIKEMHYVSTAYVCGLREGTISEDELDCGQDFRNDYEKSKLESETMVRANKHFDSLTVYRPAVIAGDSVTGYTSTYHGLYMYLQLMSVVNRNTPPGPDGRRHTPVQLDLTGDEPRNVIPVDWTSEVIVDLLLNPQAHGHTFHLTPESLLTAREIMEAGYEYFNSYGVEFCKQPVADSGEQDLLTRNAHDSMKMYKPYEESDPKFDTRNLRRFAGHLPCPAIDRQMLHRFWAYGEEDRWGKRRQPTPNVPFDMGELLRSAQNALADISDEPIQTVGLDISGPGGGQWTVEHTSRQITGFWPGLDADLTNVEKMTSEELARCLSAGGGQTDLVRLLANRFQVLQTCAGNP